MNPDQLEKLVEKHPDRALGEFADLLTPEQFDFCIRKEPGAALYFNSVCEKLSEEQFDVCCRSDPSSALFCCRALNPELIEFCCEKEPELALKTHCWGDPSLKLTKTQFTTCCGKAPAEALEYAASIMDEDLFKKCAEAEPWVAVKLCADWLTDGELVRHTAGRGKAVSTLLEYEPAHQLKFRLGSLFGRLDPDVEVVVARAIAPAI